MEGFVKDEIIVYEINEKCPEYTSIVNKALFNGFGSILKVIIIYQKNYILIEKTIMKF